MFPEPVICDPPERIDSSENRCTLGALTRPASDPRSVERHGIRRLHCALVRAAGRALEVLVP